MNLEMPSATAGKNETSDDPTTAVLALEATTIGLWDAQVTPKPQVYNWLVADKDPKGSLLKIVAHGSLNYMGALTG